MDTTLVQLFSIVVVLICTYIFFTKKKVKIDFNYFKKILISYRISKFKKNLKHDWVTDAKSIESPTILNNDNQFDSHAIYGFDTKGNSLVARINKRGFQIVEIWLQLRLADGNMYQLPVHPNTSICSREKSIWSANGLKFTILEPFIRIRVTFNGLLRNCTQNGLHSEEFIHAKFNFIWSSCAEPTHWPLDHSTSLLADALSLETLQDEPCIRPSISGYDQYGVLQGEVFLNEEAIQLSLPSLRSRRKGNNVDELRDQFELIGVCEDAVLFQIGVASNNTLTNFKYGTIRTMNGVTHPLIESDVSIELIGTSIDNIPKMFVVNFKVNGQKHNNIFYLQNKATTKMYGGSPCNFESNIIPFQCCFSSENGNGLAIFEYKHKGASNNESQIAPRNYLTFYDIQDTLNESLIVRFNEKLCQAVSIVGGKGASLSLMSSITTSEFIIPEGCCLTKFALQKQLQISDLILLVHEVEKYSLNDINELETACNITEKRFTTTPIDETIAEIVKKHLNELRQKSIELYGQETCRFAVRSSGLNEDSEESSAAGQNETVLGCLTDEDVLNAILKCWGSLFAFRSVAYRRQHGQAVNCGMGVVIQVMVPSEVSGVMFTCHPTTQNPSQILITASYGLGESVVSAAVHPDQFIVEKTWDNKISIQSRQIGEKATQIVMSENSTSTVNVDNLHAQTLCMTDEEVLTVAKIGILLQDLFEYYCDVEWAIYKNKLYILQCRAITTTNKWTEFELIHEFDFPIVSNYELTSFANCIEVCPNPLSTLCISIFTYYFNKIQHQFKGNRELHRYYGYTVFSQRLALNIFWTFLADLNNEVKIQHRVSCLAVLGEDIINDKVHKLAVKINTRNNSKNDKPSPWMILQMMWLFSKNFEFTKQLSENFKIDFNEIDNSKDLYKLILKSLPSLMEFSNHHMMSSGGSTFYKIWIMSTLLGSSQEITEDHLNDFTKILSLENNVLSGEIPKRLKNVSNVIARSGKSKEFQKLTTKECLPWLQKHVPEAEKQFQEILKEHGHRGIMEFDMYYEPWSLNPTPLLEALQSTSHMELTNTERGEVNIKNLINSLKTPKSFISKLFLRYLIPKLQSCIRSREFTKSALILVGHQFRLAFRHLGYLLEKEGKLPNANLIFFLTKYELNELIHENKTELLEKAARRQKLYPQLNKITYEEYNYGRPEPIPDVISTIDLESDCTLKGTAVYPGLIQGRACVITDISQAHLIQPNDILITTATDVGWSPYFPMISGLVTEIGGLISHGAVIAREYGIPCVIGVKGATRMFATDNQLILDANKGNISRVITKDQ